MALPVGGPRSTPLEGETLAASEKRPGAARRGGERSRKGSEAHKERQRNTHKERQQKCNVRM